MTRGRRDGIFSRGSCVVVELVGRGYDAGG